MSDTPNCYWNFMSKIIIKYFHKLVLNCGNILYLAIVYEIVLIKVIIYDVYKVSLIRGINIYIN